VIDLGAGDGRYVITAAAAEPGTLVIGIDASAATMAEASRRAARAGSRRGLPNALFVVAAAEALPSELDGIADLVAIHLPWGSLLRGALALDEDVAAGIARLVSTSGRVEILAAPSARDRLSPEVDVRRRLAGGLVDDWRRHGLELCEARPATDAEIAASGSTWARRLGLRAGDPDRAPFRLVLRPGPLVPPGGPIGAAILPPCTAALDRTAPPRRGS
jgi:16S rRNA (adenine(1408)-N(1))-methyltransferase